MYKGSCPTMSYKSFTLFQALPIMNLTVQFFLLSIQTELMGQLCSEQTPSPPSSQNQPEFCIMKTSNFVTCQLKWKSNSLNRVREHSERYCLKECCICALRTPASMLPPAMLQHSHLLGGR